MIETNLNDGDYLMWFAHFGSLEMREVNSLNEAIDIAVMLEDCDTSTFDCYGVLQAVERVGHGLIDDADFEKKCEEYKEARAKEWQERRAAQDAERKAQPGPRFSVYLSAPDGVGDRLLKSPTVIGYSLTSEQATAERDRLSALFGADRINIRQVAA